MKYIYALGVVVLAIYLIKIFSPLFPRLSPPKELPFSKKKYLLTEAELIFFKALEEAVGKEFYIFPQVHLPCLFFIQTKGKDWWREYGRIKQKSVDFVLCEPANLSPVLAIELNDSSHKREDRIERDAFVNEVFKSTNLPLLTVKWSPSYHPEQLRSQVFRMIDGKRIESQN